MLAPNQLKIVWDAYFENRRKGLSPAEAWKAASAEYEGLKAEYRAQGKQKPEPLAPPAPDDEQLTEVLCDPAARAGLYEVAPWVRSTLAEQVGPGRQPKALQGAVTTWEGNLLNEFLTLPRGAGDPREELRAKAQQLADETKVDFMAALATVKASSRELVERAAAFRPWDQ